MQGGVSDGEKCSFWRSITGRVTTCDTLLRRVWNGRDDADANPVRIFVHNLRRKLGDDAASPARMFNERGVGFCVAGPGTR